MDNNLDELDKLLVQGLNKKKLLKRLSIVFIELSILVISICIFAIVVNSHSDYLFNNNILIVSYITMIIFIIIFIIGLLLYIKFYKIKYSINNKAIYIYAILLGIISINSLLFLYLLYGPINSFKKNVVDFSDTFSKYENLKNIFYSDTEIEEIKSKRD